MTELAANIIGKLIYTECDVNSNGYLLFEVFINHGKKGSAFNVEDQKVVALFLGEILNSTLIFPSS